MAVGSWLISCSVPNLAQPDMKKRFMDLIEDTIGVSVQKRSRETSTSSSDNRSPSICLTEGNCYFLSNLDDETQSVLETIQNSSFAELVPRGKVRYPSVCLPGNVKFNKLESKYYPPVGTLSATKQLYRVAKSATQHGVCAGLSLFAGGRVPGTDYVVEHVTELQTPAQYANNMLEGILPAGDRATSAAYNWASIFGPGEIFQQTFSQSGIKLPAGLTGSTPEEAIFNALGTSKDNINLLILDRATNSIKASCWSIHEHIIGDARWNAASPASRVELMLRIQQGLIEYLNMPDAQKALEHGYNAQQAVWKAFDVAGGKLNSALQPLTGGITFALQHKKWYEDLFQELVGNIQMFLQNKLQQEISYWTSPQAVKDYSAQAAAVITKTLKTRLANLGTEIVVQTGWLR